MEGNTGEGFIPPHGGFEQLVTYQKELVIFQAGPPSRAMTRRWSVTSWYP